MIDFSFRTFKEYLKKPLEKQEVNFLIQTFSRSCAFFFFLMIFIATGGILMDQFVSGSNSKLFLIINSVVLVVFGIMLFFNSIKYRMDPLGVSQTVIFNCWASTIAVFTSLFLTLLHFLPKHIFGGNSSLCILISGLVVFGITIALYAIPVCVGLYIQNRKTIMSLISFLRICGIVYLVFFLLSIVVSVFAVWKGWEGFKSLGTIPFLIYVIFTFISPIITIYRMKTIVPYINYDDDHERKRWQNFFVFEIVEELLHMAYTVARYLAYFLSRGTGSRLG